MYQTHNNVNYDRGLRNLFDKSLASRMQPLRPNADKVQPLLQLLGSVSVDVNVAMERIKTNGIGNWEGVAETCLKCDTSPPMRAIPPRGTGPIPDIFPCAPF